MSKAKSAEGETAIWNKGAACVKAGSEGRSLTVRASHDCFSRPN